MNLQHTLVLAFILIASQSSAQPATTKSKTKQKAAVVQNALEPNIAINKKDDPFEPKFFDAAAPLQSYESNDPAKVYAWLKKYIDETPGKPDKFSTKEERKSYEDALSTRLKSVGQIPMMGVCDKKYDGDSQGYDVLARIFPVEDAYGLDAIQAKSLDVKTLRLMTKNMVHESYIGENAYGAKTEISKTTSDAYVIAFPRGKFPASAYLPGNEQSSTRGSAYETDFGRIKLNFSMPSAEARQKDKDIACLYFASISPPYLFEHRTKSTPTRDKPFESITNYHALYGGLDQMIVFNRSTGEIYDQTARKPGEFTSETPSRLNTYCEDVTIAMMRGQGSSNEDIFNFCGRR